MLKSNIRRFIMMPLTMLATLAVLAGCGSEQLSVMRPAGPVAQEQWNIIVLSFFIMVGVFTVVIAIYIYVLFRYRERKGQENMIPKQVEGNFKLEVLWTVIPFILIIIIAVPSVKGAFNLAEIQNENVLNVRVTAHQFWWEFHYPDLGFTTAQELHIPTGTRIEFELESADNVHSFWVPSLAGKTDTIPGLTNTMWFEADRANRYQGKCAELCGASHALMNFFVVAMEPDDFDEWVDAMLRFDGVGLATTPLAEQGEVIFRQSCISCHAVTASGISVFPNLAGFGSRQSLAGILNNTEEHLVEWIKDPQRFKPDNNMPGYEDFLSEEEIRAVSAYLLGLKLDIGQ